jgi:hypothetical protein
LLKWRLSPSPADSLEELSWSFIVLHSGGAAL